MDTTKTDDVGLTPARCDELRNELRGELSADRSADATDSTAPVVVKVLPSSGKKRAGYTTHKGHGAPKSKRLMAKQSRRRNRG